MQSDGVSRNLLMRFEEDIRTREHREQTRFTWSEIETSVTNGE